MTPFLLSWSPQHFWQLLYHSQVHTPIASPITQKNRNKARQKKSLASRQGNAPSSLPSLPEVWISVPRLRTKKKNATGWRESHTCRTRPFFHRRLVPHKEKRCMSNHTLNSLAISLVCRMTFDIKPAYCGLTFFQFAFFNHTPHEPKQKPKPLKQLQSSIK